MKETITISNRFFRNFFSDSMPIENSFSEDLAFKKNGLNSFNVKREGKRFIEIDFRGYIYKENVLAGKILGAWYNSDDWRIVFDQSEYALVGASGNAAIMKNGEAIIGKISVTPAILFLGCELSAGFDSVIEKWPVVILSILSWDSNASPRHSIGA